jgi:hypothetical protein
MTKNDLKKLIKSLTREVLNEDFDNSAEVESDKLTATLSEDDKVADIADLEKLLKNPDPSRVKDYGSLENYKKMLMGKIDRLKKQKNESGDPFRDIVKKYASLYRDSELSRREKEDYFKWLQTHQPDKLKKLVNKLKKK